MLLSTVALLLALGNLAGTVVVIDPGHGGQDPGSHGVFSGQHVFEDEYTYDVALRVQELVRKQQGLAFMTIRDRNDQIRDWHPSRVFPEDRDEVFALDGTTVRARTVGLRRRLAYANQIRKKFSNHRVVFLAIHFDVVGKRTDVVGVRIVTSKADCPLGQAMAKAFGERLRPAAEGPVVVSGDRSRGLRRLYILNGANSIGSKVLIELGNFLNPGDVWRIRNPEIRQDYAQRIVKAIAVAH